MSAMTTVRGLVLAAGTFLMGTLAASPAIAACSVQAADDAGFGAGATSFVVRETVMQTSTNTGLVCTGALLALLGSGDRLSATITSANGGLLGPGGDRVEYGVYGDGTTTYPLPIGTPFNFMSGQFLNLLGIFGGPATPLPIFFRTTAGSNVAAGVYTDTITIDWSWNYCRGIGALGICLGRDVGGGTSTFQIALTVTNTCAITSTPTVSFGAAPVPSSFDAVSQQIGVVCTKGLTAYSVGIDTGRYAAGTTRRMAGNGAFLAYEIFKGSSQEIWGVAGADRAVPTAPAHGVLPQSFPYTARIVVPQSTPPAGVYEDVLVVDVSF
ncbi:MAG: hypothetical protein ABS36_16830 [Acidobacteria bacterium SCN 69-37]|nr:MAG: hypothetical protein ABS36_16830 [Acidobacteria bacterium SCN 69-37]